MDHAIQAEYDRVLNYCREHAGELSEHMLQQSVDYQSGLWKAYRFMLEMVPMSLTGKTVVDFGCKFGHLIPLLIGVRCGEAIGIDAEDQYVDGGAALFPKLYANSKVLKSELGYVPLQPSTVDLVIMNEVISHVNPSFLDTVWREMARILRPGGMLFISDGNNRANLEVQAVLPELYDKWENGPDGVRTDRDVVEDNFLGRRAKIVAERCPEMTAKQVEFVAENTSGLFGDVLLETIERHRTTGELVLRPFQKGMCPVNPNSSGVVMERAIHPIQLELALAEYGFSAHQLKPVAFKPFTRPGLVGRLKDCVVYLRHQLRTLKEDSEDYRSNNVGFQLIAVKQ